MSKIMYIGLFVLGSLAAHAEFNADAFLEKRYDWQLYTLKEYGSSQMTFIYWRIVDIYREVLLMLEKYETTKDKDILLGLEIFHDIYKLVLSKVPQLENSIKSKELFNSEISMIKPLEEAVGRICKSKNNMQVIKQEKKIIESCIKVLMK